jgi:hypothetical protein
MAAHGLLLTPTHPCLCCQGAARRHTRTLAWINGRATHAPLLSKALVVQPPHASQTQLWTAPVPPSRPRPPWSMHCMCAAVHASRGTHSQRPALCCASVQVRLTACGNTHTRAAAWKLLARHTAATAAAPVEARAHNGATTCAPGAAARVWQAGSCWHCFSHSCVGATAPAPGGRVDTQQACCTACAPLERTARTRCLAAASCGGRRDGGCIVAQLLQATLQTAQQRRAAQHTHSAPHVRRGGVSARCLRQGDSTAGSTRAR